MRMRALLILSLLLWPASVFGVCQVKDAANFQSITGCTVQFGTLTIARPASSGTNLAAADFTRTGWGSVSFTQAVTGKDIGFSVNVATSVPADQSPNPTLMLTFKNGAWPAPPHAVCNRFQIGTQDALGSSHLVTTTTTTLTITYLGTPGTGRNYGFSCVVGP